MYTLAEVYGSALPCISDALLHLEPNESLTSHKKLKTFLDFPAVLKKKLLRGVCVCMCVCDCACL